MGFWGRLWHEHLATAQHSNYQPPPRLHSASSMQGSGGAREVSPDKTWPLSLHGSHTGIALRVRPLFPTPGSKHVISAWILGGARYIGAQRSGGGTGTRPNRNSELKSCSTRHGTCQGREERNVNFDSDRACAPAGLTDATNVLRVGLTADSAAIYRKFHSADPAPAMVLPLSNSSW